MLIKLLRTHLGPYRKPLAVVVVLTTVQTVCTLLLPTLNADIIDKGVVRGDTDYIWRTGGLMLLVTVVQVFFAVAAVRVAARVAMSFGRDVRGELFHRVTGFSAQDVASFGASSLITRITNDVTQVQVLVMMAVTMLVAAPITMVGGVVMAVREDAGLSLMLLVAVPALVGAVGVVISRMLPQFQAMQERIDRINLVLREQITGIRVVRAFGREPHEARRFDRVNRDLTETSLRAGRLMAMMFPLVVFVLNASSVGAIWLGGDRIASGDMQVGALIAFLSYLIQILMAVMMATFVVGQAPRASVSAERISDVLDAVPSIADPVDPVTELSGPASLELRNVEFRYPGADFPVLCDISFTARAGQTTAIIGSTGSGKSTLVNLVPRLFDVTGGSVRIGGVDVRETTMRSLHDTVGVVSQDAHLFHDTIRANLAYARPEASEADLLAACSAAQVRALIDRLPDGLDTVVGDRGHRLSGGEKQRIALARLLLKNPRIVVLDEATAHLDSESETAVQRALDTALVGRTSVVIAHRLSTIRRADQILVIVAGRVVERGTHAALLAAEGVYAELYRTQFEGADA